jgi:hypothetical protein
VVEPAPVAGTIGLALAGPRPGGAWHGLADVNEAQTEVELTRLRQSVSRGVPFSSEGWVKGTAAALGLEFTMRGPGHPPGHDRTVRGEEPGLFA